MSFIISGKKPIFSLAVALSFCLIARGYIDSLLRVMLFNLGLGEASSKNYIIIFLLLSAMAIVVAVPHELLHGLVYKLFGGRVRYGLRLVGAYVQETSGLTLHRSKFLMMLVAPVTLISAMAVALPIALGGIIFLLNLLGSIPDMLMAMQLIAGCEDSYVMNNADGFVLVKVKR